MKNSKEKINHKGIVKNEENIKKWMKDMNEGLKVLVWFGLLGFMAYQPF